MSEKLETYECLKEDCFLCRNISSEWLELVRLKRDVLFFKKNEVIFRDGEKVDGIYFILSGKVKVDMPWGDKSYIVRLASDGDILGHRGFGLDEYYPVNGTALESTTVCFIPSELFKSLLRTNQELLYSLVFFFADELKRTEKRMKRLVHMLVKGRVAESILMIAEAFGVEENGMLKFNMSRKEMAAMSGTTYETVIRMLNELVKDGLISLNDKNIQILNNEALEVCCQD
jgi:CRP-like cAMP-binding protein